MPKLLSYTRLPIDNVYYDPKLAYSMHLALEKDGKWVALNHNSGVLFVKGTENEDGSINAMSIKDPYVFAKGNGEYGVAAIRVLGDGEDDETSKGSVVMFSTVDFAEYTECGLVKLSEEYIERVACVYENGECKYSWVDATGACKGDNVEALCGLPVDCHAAKDCHDMGNIGIEGMVPCNVIEIDEDTATFLEKKLMTPVNCKVEVAEEICVKCNEDVAKALAEHPAAVYYSDGTVESRRIDWNLEGVDAARPGDYKVKGRIHKEHYEFPVAFNRADPCIAKWNGKYYFIATNDADYNHTLYIREADSIPELVNAKEHLILDSTTYEGIGGLLWAPEFHVVNGRMYIFHACTPGEFFFEESHVMALKEGGDPTKKEDWERPRRVVKKDGSDICEAGKEITLDMTCFEWEGSYYVCWSQRQFLPKDLGAWLYFAKLNPDEPWKLESDPMVISKPDYGWANNHTFVDEGPFAITNKGELKITFSSAAVDTSYVVSLLTLKEGADPMDMSAWKKKNYPILTSRSVEGEFGTGHNAYVIDDEGIMWNTYHARPGVDGVRSSGIRRVHFDASNEPRLDVTEDIDVREEFMDVETVIRIG